MRRRRKTLGLATLTAAAVLLAAAMAVAITDVIAPAVISGGGGGGLSGDGSVALQGTLGQPAAGTLAGGDYVLQAGFWTSRPTATAVDDETPVAGDTLQPAYPNPFNPATTVRFTLARAGQVRVGIYDVRGRLVRQLVDASLPAGQHERTWRGVDLAGDAVSSGVYVLRLQTEQGHFHQKLTLLK
jgi:hypothetical protein